MICYGQWTVNHAFYLFASAVQTPLETSHWAVISPSSRCLAERNRAFFHVLPSGHFGRWVSLTPNPPPPQ